MSHTSQSYLEPLRLAIHGSTGRMGQEILKLAGLDASWTKVTTVARDGWGDVIPADVDVVIDFSLPLGLLSALEWCTQNKVPVVSGTTGLTPNQSRALEEAALRVPVLWSANMSIGVHILARAIEALKPLATWDFQISETHHRNKVDKPSGTALFLQNKVQSVLPSHFLPDPVSIRGGTVVGTHQLEAFGENEIIRFEHEALSRSVFAKGAMLAARWLAKNGQPGRLHTMNDVL